MWIPQADHWKIFRIKEHSLRLYFLSPLSHLQRSGTYSLKLEFIMSVILLVFECKVDNNSVLRAGWKQDTMSNHLFWGSLPKACTGGSKCKCRGWEFEDFPRWERAPHRWDGGSCGLWAREEEQLEIQGYIYWAGLDTRRGKVAWKALAIQDTEIQEEAWPHRPLDALPTSRQSLKYL